MKNFIQAGFLLFLSFISVTAQAENDVSIYVDYRHGPIHVHHLIPCSYKMTCWLQSLEEANVSWRVEVTPTYLGHGMVSVVVVANEIGEKVVQSEILSKFGEKTALTWPRGGGDDIDLTLLTNAVF